MPPAKFADIEKKAKDVLAKDLDPKYLLSVKHSSPVGATFTSESTASMAKGEGKVVGKMVAEKYKVAQVAGLTVDKIQISQVKDPKSETMQLEVIKDLSYVVPGVDGVKGLMKFKLPNAAVSTTPTAPSIGAEYSDKMNLGNLLFNPGKGAVDFWFSSAPAKDLTVGLEVKEFNGSSLKGLATKGSYTAGSLFTAFQLSPAFVESSLSVLPFDKATTALYVAYDATSEMSVGLSFARETQKDKKKTSYLSQKMSASVQYLISKETTARVAATYEDPTPPKDAVDMQKKQTIFQASLAHKLAKGATAIINVKYIDSPQFGMQFKFDA